MKYVKKLSLDVGDASTIPIVYAKQLDKDSRFLEVTLYDHGEKIFPESKTAAHIRCGKPDGTGVFNPATINEDGTILVSLTEQMLAVPGRVIADIELTDRDANILSSANFYIDVIPIPTGTMMDSTNEFIMLMELYQKIEDIIHEVDPELNLADIAYSGNIKDLVQTDPFILYCGTSEDLV